MTSIYRFANELDLSPVQIELNIAQAVILSHEVSKSRGWWTNKATGEPLDPAKLVPEKIALAHSELSEALEGFRRDKMDDHLPHRPSIEVELADLLHRVFDLAGALNLDLAGAFIEKANYNLQRADHSAEVRNAPGGKKF